MWYLALIVACSMGGEVCTYRTDVAVTESKAQCERLGYLVGGGALERKYGSFPRGEVTVTCRQIWERTETGPAAIDIARR